MESILRSVKFRSGHTLTVWDDNSRASTGQYQLRYTFLAPPDAAGRPGDVLFCGSDYGVSPMHAIDSDAALLGLLGFLTLKPGDTDSDYFAEYTDAQRAWCESSACESLACDVSVAEEAGGCACSYVWDNVDGWECEDAPTVTEYKLLDLGEDGSQYFPGDTAAFSQFQHRQTGVGDTAKEALDDALESMAQNDHEVSPLQEAEMHATLDNPDKSAHDSPEPHDCEKQECDWHHYVSIRYNVRD